MFRVDWTLARGAAAGGSFAIGPSILRQAQEAQGRLQSSPTGGKGRIAAVVRPALPNCRVGDGFPSPYRVRGRLSTGTTAMCSGRGWVPVATGTTAMCSGRGWVPSPRERRLCARPGMGSRRHGNDGYVLRPGMGPRRHGNNGYVRRLLAPPGPVGRRGGFRPRL